MEMKRNLLFLRRSIDSQHLRIKCCTDLRSHVSNIRVSIRQRLQDVILRGAVLFDDVHQFFVLFHLVREQRLVTRASSALLRTQPVHTL